LTQRPIDHLVIEAVHSMPKQGVTSMFSFGTSYGSILGLAAGLQLPYSSVPPRAWRKAVGCGPSPDAARQAAGRLYPGAALHLARKNDAGRADAILIARFGQRQLGIRTEHAHSAKRTIGGTTARRKSCF
jgi:crossover junction endodeoxyribonuclease RuvC